MAALFVEAKVRAELLRAALDEFDSVDEHREVLRVRESGLDCLAKKRDAASLERDVGVLDDQPRGPACVDAEHVRARPAVFFEDPGELRGVQFHGAHGVVDGGRPVDRVRLEEED
jgi:hypothetical protein